MKIFGIDFFGSRSGLTAPHGKLDVTAKTKLSAQVKDDADAFSASIGLNFSEWNRNLIMTALYGKDAVVSMYSDRVDRITKNLD